VSPIAPAQPPARRFPKKNFPFSLELVLPRNALYNASLTEKLMAVVGKYLMTFARFPLQKAFNPSSLYTLEKQSTIPLYYLSETILWFVC